MTIYNSAGISLYEAPVTKSAIIKYALMGDYYIELSFNAADYIDFQKGCYILYQSRKFEILSNVYPERGANGGVKYTLRFDAQQNHMKNCKVFWLAGENKETTFHNTTDLASFGNLIVANVNRYLGRNSWVLGGVPSDLAEQTKLVSFNGDWCWDALNTIAETFDVEWWTTEDGDEVRLFFGKMEFGTEEDFVEGDVVTSIPAKKGDDSNYGTRFYVFGSSRNLTSSYNESLQGGVTNHVSEPRLRLPNGQEYIDAWEGLEQKDVVEQVVFFEDIFPKNTETVTEIETVEREIIEGEKSPAYIMLCEDTPFSTENIIAGETLGCQFTSGSLMGREFELIINEDNFDKKFEIVAQTESYGEEALIIPNESLHPKAGDTFILTGVELPQERISEAEYELLDAGISWAAKNSSDTDVYDCPTNPVYCRSNDKNYDLGQKVKLIGSRFGSEGRSSRIQGYEKKLYDEYQAVYTVGDNTAYSRLGDIEKNIQSSAYAERFGVSSGVGVYIIRSKYDTTVPTDYNVYSALAAEAIFLNKRKGGTVTGDVTFGKQVQFAEGFSTTDFAKGNVLGSGAALYRDANGNTVAEVDKLIVRQEATFSELVINQTTFKLGETVHTMGGCEITKVEEADGYFRCYYDNKDGKRLSGFVAGDQARCQRFDPNYDSITKYYWRLVVGVGDDYVDLSTTDYDGSGLPDVGDEIVQLGHRTDQERQNAIVIASTPQPSLLQYRGINSYKMPVPETQLQPNNNIFTGTVHIKSNSTGFEELDAWKTISKQSADAYAKAEEALSNAGSGGVSREDMVEYVDDVFGGVQEQIDGVVESHFKEVDPMLTNSPAVDWTTAEAKEAHVGDTYTNIKTGGSWKWQLYNGSYQWVEIEDTATQKALQDAANAQDTADSKRRVFTLQPKPPYEVGDLWAAGDSAPLKRCIKNRATGSFVKTDWELADNSQSYADSLFDTIEYGKGNLIRNSGFTGGYLSRNFTSSTSVSESSELFSPSLEYWSYTNATVQTSSVSESKAEVVLSSGSLSQTLKNNVSVGDNYIISFRAKGTSLTVSVAGVAKTVTLTSTWERYVIKFAAVSNNANFRITSATCTLCELQLERGNVPSSWSYSLWDYTLDFAYYQALQYLAGAIKDGSTTIAGGLILSNVLALGNYLNGEMTQMTAGVSGVYNDNEDVAFWGGGSIEQAILTVAKFRDNPQYNPSEEEWASMAKFAVTHGGDVFMRGYIHALGGYFRGTVDIADQKILLNADGSGHFANGNVRWDSAGRVQKSAPDSVIWTSVSGYDSGVVDYHQGSYLILSYNSFAENPISEFTLAIPAFDNFSIFIRNGYYDGGTERAFLLGKFKATKNGITETATALTVTGGNETANIIAELVYQSDGYWHLQSEDYGIGTNGVMYVGAAKSESFFNGYFTNVDDEGNTLNFRVIDGRLKLLS